MNANALPLTGFDASAVPEMNDFSPLPAGRYVAMFVEGEKRDTNANDGSWMLSMKGEVVDGPARGRMFWANLNLGNKSQVACDIAQRELGAICRAIGIIRPNSSDDLLNRPFLVDLDVEKSKQGKEQNRVKKYLATTDGAPVPAAPAPPPATHPGFGRPPAAPAVPSAPAAANTPPWKRNAA